MYKNKLKNINKNNRKKIFIFLSVFLFLLLLFPQLLQAESKVHGKAWWGEALGYLYFDCTEYQLSSILDEPGNFNDFPLPRGFHFDSEVCAIDQHVNIDDNNNFYGSAFNFVKGLVNFGGSTTPVSVPDYNFNVNCPNLCDATNNCSACYNPETQRVYGWAQVADTSQELIRLDSYIDTSENMLQIKNWNMASSTETFYSDLAPGDFVGHSSSTVGGFRAPLSFNCKSENKDNLNTACSERDYYVYIENPQVGSMSAPNWSFEDACNPGRARGASLRWELSSGWHDGFEVVVMDNLSTTVSTSTISSDVICYSGVEDSIANQYSIPNTIDEKCKNYSDLDYNTSYTWFLRLRYFNGEEVEWTDWYQFGVNDGHLGAEFDEDNSYYALKDGDKKTFATYLHEFPVPYFTWSPEKVEIGADEPTIFTALDPTTQKSVAYSTASPNTPVACDEYMSCGYNWSSSDLGAVIDNPSVASTGITFWTSGDTSVNLRISDSDGYYCTKSRLIENINYDLPIWREVKAE
ncbi:MAG: hypothetical protein PF488_04015 [Patescibacteria group bacterium]|jgi:hypothetical protein|nr:hypothetical protein [Patescibacteria group bacterium]